MAPTTSAAVRLALPRVEGPTCWSFFGTAALVLCCTNTGTRISVLLSVPGKLHAHHQSSSQRGHYRTVLQMGQAVQRMSQPVGFFCKCQRLPVDFSGNSAQGFAQQPCRLVNHRPVCARLEHSAPRFSMLPTGNLYT